MAAAKQLTTAPGRRYRILTLAMLVSLAGVALADDPDVKPASEAKNHVDQKGTYEMIVKSTKNAVPRKEYYLDSEEDFRDEKNLALVISYDDIQAFQEAGIADPAEHFRGKSIRVTGQVIRELEQVRIRVQDPKQIKVVPPPKP